MFKKKGQSANAAGAAVLILIIMLVIIMYVLFLPPSDREELLRGNETEENGDKENILEENESILLEEQPGRLDYIAEREYEHNIPSFFLYKTTNAVELKKINPFVVRNAVFDRKSYNTTFFIQDLENTKNVVLSFQAKKHSGILTIRLNGDVIFDGEITTFNVEPISLPFESLQEKNILDFSVSEVGWQFWKSNEYQLENIRVIADVTDISRQESNNVFYITSIEAENVERAWIKFSPECVPDVVGTLELFINNRIVFSGVPDCGILNTHEFAPDLLLTGSNNVVFKTGEGSYLIDLIEVKTNLKETPYVVYYFELNSSQYDDILHDELNVNLTFEFVEEGDLKEAKLIINGHETGLYTRERIYSKVIDAYIQKDNNALKIVPKETLDIIKLTIRLDD